MKSPRFRPLDLSANEDATERMPEPPRDPEFERLETPRNLGSVTRGEEREVSTVELPPLNLNPRPGTASTKEPRAVLIYVGAAIISCLWALAPIMFAIGYRRAVAPFESDGFAISVLALMALGPVALVWLAAFLLHQGVRLAAQARRTQSLADSLVQPAALAARGVGSAVENVRSEIEQATAAAAHARDELLTLRTLLAEETERLVTAAAGSNRAATDLTQELGAERERMDALAEKLGSQAGGVVDAISQHARMVSEASDLAETQIREAEAALAARAADLAAAAGEASDTARTAGEDLARQVARLETASLGVGDQVRVLEEGLTEQRAALVATAHGMRADHEAFSTEAESQKAQLVELLAHARGGAGELNETAASTAEALRQLIDQSSEQLRAMAQTAAQERDLFGAAATESMNAASENALEQREAMEQQAREAVEALSAAANQALATISEIGDRQREAMEGRTREVVSVLSASAAEARQSAEEHGRAVHDRIDQLREAGFTAGQQADAAFDARLSQARAMIEQSAQLVEEAGARSSTRLSEGVEAARATIAELERLLGDIDARVASLPETAQNQAQVVRDSVERGIGELLEAARRTANETQAIDAAFQDRVRRNYEMLSEAVRLMGVVAGAAGVSPRQPAARPAQTPAQAADASGGPAEPPPARQPDDAAPAGLRPRLRLTPTATDEEFKTVFDSAGGREAPPQPAAPPPSGGAGESWTWKELLSSMDEGMGESLGDDKSLADALLGEIGIMGIDAGALLPRMRIDQIAAAIQAGEPAAGREIVRRLAPAAVRRLARRMMADRGFRAQVDRYVQRYAAMVAETRGDGQNFVVGALLGSDQGRAYLLFDAAISEW